MRSRRGRILALAGVLVAAGLFFVGPSARQIWWLHVRTDVPQVLVVPVAGIATTDLVPSFGVRRSEDHFHEGIDIMAPAGTPVLAAADGVVYEDRPNDKGGNVAWILGAGRQLYYYAHMRELDPSVRRGRLVRAGQRVGSVGNTGNAIRTPSHLHFEIMEVTGDSLPLEYQEVDPYPALARKGQSRSAPASTAAPTPPQWPSLPLEPGDADTLNTSEIASRARSVADLVEEALTDIDPYLGMDADADARRLAQLQRLAPLLRARADELEASGAKASPGTEERSTREPLATALYLATEQADSIRAAWTDCRPRDLDVALSALQGVSLGLEPGSTEARSELGYFFFEGHQPGIVPGGGGWVIVAGSPRTPRRDREIVLRVRETGRVVERLPAVPLGDGAAAAWVPAASLSPHAGNCLALRTEERGALDERAEAPELPLCVPRADPTRYRLIVRLEYDTPARLVTLPRKTLQLRNDDCDEPLEVTQRIAWDDAPRGELIELGEAVITDSHEAEVTCRPEGMRVRCDATLPPASCELPAGSPGRVTEWESEFAPTLSIPETRFESQSRSDLVQPGAVPKLCAHLTRDHASSETHMRFELVAANGRQRSVFFESPVETLETARRVQYEAPPHEIEASFEAGEAESPGSVCATLTSAACGF